MSVRISVNIVDRKLPILNPGLTHIPQFCIHTCSVGIIFLPFTVIHNIAQSLGQAFACNLSADAAVKEQYDRIDAMLRTKNIFTVQSIFLLHAFVDPLLRAGVGRRQYNKEDPTEDEKHNSRREYHGSCRHRLIPPVPQTSCPQ